MPAPANRVPVRIARGAYTDLNTNISSIGEGEICYATDEQRLYMNIGGTLVAAGANLGTASIGDLSDVDITGVTSGQILQYNGSSFVVVDMPESGAYSRGDGGNFQTGTVDVPFQSGIYGGGNITTSEADPPAEFVNGAFDAGSAT